MLDEMIEESDADMNAEEDTSSFGDCDEEAVEEHGGVPLTGTELERDTALADAAEMRRQIARMEAAARAYEAVAAGPGRNLHLGLNLTLKLLVVVTVVVTMVAKTTPTLADDDSVRLVQDGDVPS